MSLLHALCSCCMCDVAVILLYVSAACMRLLCVATACMMLLCVAATCVILLFVAVLLLHGRHGRHNNHTVVPYAMLLRILNAKLMSRALCFHR